MNNNEPIILGKVKKGGSGKPIVAIIVFLFIGAIIFLLPTILNYFGDYSIIDLIKNGEIIDFINNHDSYMNGNISLKKDNTTTTTVVKSNNYINNKTIIKYDNFSLSDFVLNNNSVSFKVTVNKYIDFDKDYYYFILSKDSKVLEIIKITGQIESSENIIYNFKNKMENLINIEGNVKKYGDLNYPEYKISSDESGLASIVCTTTNDRYEYLFNNNKLIRIKQIYTYIDSGDTNTYISEYEKYTGFVTEINNSNNTATIIEDNKGFVFNADIDLKTYTRRINGNYYSYNDNLNKIKFDMDAKGYDCK